MKFVKNFNNKELKLKILNIIRNSENPITKKKITNQLNINQSTISALVNQLKKNGLVIEPGSDISTGGRRPKKYQLNKEFGYVIGVDIGGENTRALITDLLGGIVLYLKEKTKSEENKCNIENKIFKITDRLISESKIPKEKILGIGVGVSGGIKNSGYIIFCPNINGLKNFQLKDYLEEKFSIPVLIDESVRCMAIAEKRYGVTKQNNNFIYISLGIGIGAGIFINGEIYRGDGERIGITGEIGHITVSPEGPVCKCGNEGCLETFASGPAILRRAKEALEKGIMTSLSDYIKNDFNNLSPELISKAAESGDKFSFYLIDKTGEYIGLAISVLLNLFGIDLIVLGGGIIKCGNTLINAIIRTVKIKSLDIVSKEVSIFETKLGDYNAALGAATNFIDNLFTSFDNNIFDRSIYLKRSESK